MFAPSTESSKTLPETLRLQITDEDILLGTPLSDTECAISRAVRREVFNLGYGEAVVRTCYNSVSVYREGFKGIYDQKTVYDHGYSKFVHDFDARKKVEPFFAEFTG